MDEDRIAKASVTIDAVPDEVWDALTDPQMAKRYMFGSTVDSDFREGSPITWSGEWQGKPYQDKGVILRANPARELAYSHFSPLSGQPDAPESYHTVTIRLSAVGRGTRVELSQDKNATAQEHEEAEANWAVMLRSLKGVVEG